MNTSWSFTNGISILYTHINHQHRFYTTTFRYQFQQIISNQNKLKKYINRYICKLFWSKIKSSTPLVKGEYIHLTHAQFEIDAFTFEFCLAGCVCIWMAQKKKGSPIKSPLQISENKKFKLIIHISYDSSSNGGCWRMHTYNRLCSRFAIWWTTRVWKALATDFTIQIVKYSQTNAEYLRTYRLWNDISLFSGKCSLFISKQKKKGN